MSAFHFRFRKSLRLSKHFRLTFTKRGVSLNLRLGHFSRSWGTQGNRTTLDAPGRMGLSWQKEEKRSKDKQSGGPMSGQERALYKKNYQSKLRLPPR